VSSSTGDKPGHPIESLGTVVELIRKALDRKPGK
jgi:hypothetical protein